MSSEDLNCTNKANTVEIEATLDDSASGIVVKINDLLQVKDAEHGSHVTEKESTVTPTVEIEATLDDSASGIVVEINDLPQVKDAEHGSHVTDKESTVTPTASLSDTAGDGDDVVTVENKLNEHDNDASHEIDRYPANIKDESGGLDELMKLVERACESEPVLRKKLTRKAVEKLRSQKTTFGTHFADCFREGW